MREMKSYIIKFSTTDDPIKSMANYLLPIKQIIYKHSLTDLEEHAKMLTIVLFSLFLLRLKLLKIDIRFHGLQMSPDNAHAYCTVQKTGQFVFHYLEYN